MSPDFLFLEQESLSLGLAEVTYWLQQSYNKVKKQPITGKIAFLGTPGSGKTTTLCKYLANKVFMENKQAQVLKLENETPSSDDALHVFCDFLSVPFYRDPIESEKITDTDLLLIDSPGTPFNEKQEWDTIKNRLDTLNVETRVLVINSAYEAEVIKKAYQLAKILSATHVAFTHLDEIHNYAKLWEFVLYGHLSPLSVSYGQNITSDFSESMLDFLINKTFPPIVIK